MGLNKGQISAVILWAAGIISTVVLGYSSYTAIAINSLKDNRTNDIQRVTVTETKVLNIEQDISEIKMDIKEILRKLNEK